MGGQKRFQGQGSTMDKAMLYALITNQKQVNFVEVGPYSAETLAPIL